MKPTKHAYQKNTAKKRTVQLPVLGQYDSWDTLARTHSRRIRDSIAAPWSTYQLPGNESAPVQLIDSATSTYSGVMAAAKPTAEPRATHCNDRMITTGQRKASSTMNLSINLFRPGRQSIAYKHSRDAGNLATSGRRWRPPQGGKVQM